MRVLCPVVEPAAHLTIVTAAELFQGGPVGPKAIGYNDLWSAVPLHGFLEEFQRGITVPRLRHQAFQYLTFVIGGPPEIMCHPIDLHVDRVQVPAPSALGG